MGEDKTRRIVAIQAANIEWLVCFSPQDGNQYKLAGIKFGHNGVCHTIHRQLLLGDNECDVGAVEIAFVSTERCQIHLSGDASGYFLCRDFRLIEEAFIEVRIVVTA